VCVYVCVCVCALGLGRCTAEAAEERPVACRKRPANDPANDQMLCEQEYRAPIRGQKTVKRKGTWELPAIVTCVRAFAGA
jgi:hypothetical protein